MRQPPSRDPGNQSGQLSQPLHAQQSDQMVPLEPLSGNILPPNYAQEEHPGEEAHYNMVPQPPPGNYPAPYYPDKLPQPKPRRASTIAILILLLLVLILGTTTVLALRYAGTSQATTQPTAIAQPGATPAATQPGAGQATPVPTPTPAPTGDTSATGTPAATAQPAATVTSETLTKNILLTCGPSCNDPIRVTITTIQIDDANGRMVWNLSLKDITGNNVSYGVSTFELEANATQTQIPATFSQSSGNLTNNDPYAIQATFAFVPIQSTMYTLTAVFYDNQGITMNFDPVQITF